MKNPILTSLGFHVAKNDWKSWKIGNDANIRRAKRYSGVDGVDNTVTREVLALFYYSRRCAYCGKDCGRKTRSIDHMTPLSRGGKHSVYNIVLACKNCNNDKGDKTLLEYILEKREKRKCI